MAQEAQGFFVELHKVLGVVNLYVGPIAFAITIGALIAARQAKSAAERAVGKLAKFDVISEVSSATAIAEEIRRYQDQGSWALLPERYDVLVKAYIHIKAYEDVLTEKEQISMQSGSIFATEMGKGLRELRAIGEAPDPARYNLIITERINDLTELLVRLKRDYESS